MSKKIIFIILGIFILGIGLFIFVGKNKIGERKTINSFNFLKVEKGDVRQTVNVDGTVVATKEIDLRFQVSGTIEDINYKIGDEIKKDEVLANLNSIDQKLAVKQREAGLAQAKANLNLVLAGANDQDISVYRSKVDSARKILETTSHSTNEDIKNSEARVASAQISLDNAIENLKTKERQNDVDLSIAYKEVRSAVESAFLIVEKTLDDVNDILEDDDLDDLFSAKDIKYKTESSNKYFLLNESFELVLENSKNVKNNDYQEIDNLIKETKENLKNTQSLLDSVFNGLVLTITSSVLSQPELEVYKTEVSNLRTNIMSVLTSIENKEQAILQIRTVSVSTVSGAKAVISTAQAALDLEKSNFYSIKSKAETQNIQAENSLQLADNELASKISTPRDVDIAYLQAKVYEASVLLNTAQENLKKTILLSPVDGVIVDVRYEVGELVNNSDVFIKLTAYEKKIEANIPEIEIGKVEIDDEVEIVLDAFSDKIFNGKIISIDPVETNIQGVVYYKADIIFNDATSSKIVFPGMTADINILSDYRNDVMVLPKSSVKKGNDKFYVQIFKNGEISFKDINIGLVGDSKIEIISGVNEGEEIVDFVLKNNQ